ncbi:hypothetical protein AMATHDRAFT_145281 [Amanita thiersii Skay4041]|uniref:Phospholipase D/nuclease n=1 Tax=Amanita thiersii Skay4041 TaxID=703135 RepID=A0A2A9NM32_9AGAR|nr:hypothetical protein AMATHDRAFT_145281 [Amanita thiersii Skay4041]
MASRPHDVVDLVSDDDTPTDGVSEAGLNHAIPNFSAKASTSKISSVHVPAQSSSNKSDNPTISAFLSERAQLERERRERQKRLRGQAGLDDSGNESDEPPAKRQQTSFSLRPYSDDVSDSSIPPANSIRPSPLPQVTNPEEKLFWDGELRQTATQHAEPRKDGRPTFRLTEILGKKSDLSFAILSSYSLDWAWIYQFFDPALPVIMVAQPDETGEAALKYVFPNWIKAAPRLPAGRGCMHMKFMLLFYKGGRLRVVVSTANLIAYDWRDMENSIWLQDVPLRSSPIPHDPKAPDDFPTVLQRMLYAVNVQPALATMSIDDLRRRWDWSKIKVHLVPSIAGKHQGWPNVIKTGHPSLMMAVRTMGLRTGKGRSAKELMLECQGSSLGFYTTQWMNEFHWSARGESAEDWLDEPKNRREKLPYPPIKIIFPSKKTVQESALGEPGGGTIFCRRRQWAAKNFPREKFHDSKSKGGPVLMHAKRIIALMRERSLSTRSGWQEESETEDDEIQVIESAVGWAYVGSHNFTNAAWGTLSGSGFDPVLNIYNYELGVVFPLKDVQQVEQVACWERPPRKYNSRDEPWIQEESIYHQQVE